MSVAVITGASRRIGATIARACHAQGYAVVIHYHHSDVEANALVAELNQQRKNSALALPLDLADIGAMANFVQTIINHWGQIDVLINNASTFYPTALDHVSTTQWDDLFTSNVKGAFFLTQAMLPSLRQQQGCVINITDIHAGKPLKDYPVYCMAKAALEMMTKSLARECGPDVRINAVAPGAIAWPEGDSEIDSAQQQAIIAATALKRHGHPDHIAQAVLSLLANDYITGVSLPVDGGRSLR